MAKAYKLFRIKRSDPGKVFPLYVLANESTPLGIWVNAKSGEVVNGKVKSRLGLLQYRPGWHCSDIPLAVHIGIKENGKIKYMRPDTVWCEVEYNDANNYSDEAKHNGLINGRFDYRKAYLDHIPTNGFYRFKTNPMMLGDWIITDKIKVNRILSDEEVALICNEAGYEPLPRIEPVNINTFGFTA